MPSSRLVSGLLLSGIIAPGVLAAATLSPPDVQMTLRNSEFTPDAGFISGTGATYEDHSITNADGSTERNIQGHRNTSGTSEVSHSIGGGSMIWTQSGTLAASLKQGVSTAPGSWSFESSFRFSTTLDYASSASTYGNFYFIVVPENRNTLSFDRYVSILVYQPLSIRLDLAATFSNGDLSDLFASTVLLKSPFNLSGVVSSISASTLLAATDPISNTSGSTGNVRYAITATADLGAVHYDLQLTPVDPSNPGSIELRWFMDYESKLIKTGVNSFTTSLTAEGGIHESLVVKAIPETSSAGSIAVALSSACLARRRRR